MIRVGILGDIGSGKSYVAKSFGYPVFNADRHVSELYKKNKKIFNKLKKALPKYINKFPINKIEISNAILDNELNLKKIVNIVHFEVRRKMKFFLEKNREKKVVILDIPLLLENKINNKDDILIFVYSQKSKILKRLKKRKNFNMSIYHKFKKLQLPLDYKKKNSHFIIKNDFKKTSVRKQIKNILRSII